MRRPPLPARLSSLALLSAAVALPAQDAEPLRGIWQGAATGLVFGMHLALHVQVGADGELAAVLDYLDEGFSGLRVDPITRDGDLVEFAVPWLHARFAGRVDDGARRLVGTWYSGSGRIPLAFDRVDAVRLPARPQVPKGRPPYRSIEVSFGHVPGEGLDESFRPAPVARPGAITLAATLTVPRGEGPFPGIVLIAGSGYQSRDATVRAHRPFLVLADRLTRGGFAVLRYDKRGCWRSTGTLAGVTTRDLALDARAALRFMLGRADVDPRRVGLVGHSEGGVIAPMTAVGPDAEQVAFVVCLAPLGVPGIEAIPRQVELLATVSGLSEDDVGALVGLRRALLDTALAGGDDAEVAEQAAAAWRDLSADGRAAIGGHEENLQAWSRAAGRRWLRFIAGHDPAADFARLRCPVLVVFGSNDLQVDPGQNLPPIREALAAAGHEDCTFELLPGLNHYLQTCETGDPGRYYEIEETMAPRALDAVSRWLARRFVR